MVWYYSCMESECPDPWPGLRMLPDNFEFDHCRCCNALVTYFGRMVYPGGNSLTGGLTFKYSPYFKKVMMNFQAGQYLYEGYCETLTQQAIYLAEHWVWSEVTPYRQTVQCTG